MFSSPSWRHHLARFMLYSEMKCLTTFVCIQCCSRYDFDFFFGFQEVVNDLVKVDFLYTKQKTDALQTMFYN